MMFAFVRLAYRSFRTNIDAPTLAMMIFLPLLFLYVMGLMYDSILPAGVATDAGYVSYIVYLVPGVIAQSLIWSATQAGAALWLDKRFGMFEQILSGPYTRLDYILGTILTMLAAGFLSSILTLAMAIPFLLGVQISVIGLMTALIAIVLGSLLLGSIMLSISAKVKSSQAFGTLSVILALPLTFASSAFYPITENTLLILKILAFLNPISYISDLIRVSIIGTLGAAEILELLVLLVESIASLGIALNVYRKIRPD